ncbi:phosphoribosyltransferase [Pontibacter ruber]|uniref:Phosphoribosyltransferase n=1 Tax=Pontibacter ruber TaxID=1343895 RepID=A0ABW5D171_9BACT|nr:phosphoribosyltransferase family protein [Pontibacter ruber]
MIQNKIRNRREAAVLLAEALAKYKGQPGVVLAIPRGGVPIAAHIARELHMPLDLILTKKIGHPANPEFAIGSVSIDTVQINEEINVPHEYIDAEVNRIRESLREKQQLFLGNRKPVDLRDRIVIIVDDGIATGNTLIATIKLVQIKQPRKVVVAVPVAPPSAVRRIGAMVDEIICLLAPPDFFAVGQFYDEFTQVSDEEVIELLNQDHAT